MKKANLGIAALKTAILFIFVLGGWGAKAVVSINTSATMGYYRDSAQNGHVPLYYNLSYEGAHEGGVQSSLVLILNDDFAVNNWSVIPSQVLITYPLGEGYSPWRRSRIQLGRQLFVESFDVSLLDGVQMPIYWSRTGGVSVFGGNVHVMDLLDPEATPLAGATVFEELLGARVKFGYQARQLNLSERVFTGSILKAFDFALSPQFLVKAEANPATNMLSQSFNELLLSLSDKFSVSAAYSYRTPQRIPADQNIFLYSVFAQSPQEMQQYAANWQVFPELALSGFVRVMNYNSAFNYEQGTQEEGSFSWVFTPRQSISPYFDHILSYGGELYDTGVLYKLKVSDTSDFRLELAGASFDKINNINGYAYDARTGLSFLLATRLTAMAWVEVERNPLYDFDGRIIANVTYFN